MSELIPDIVADVVAACRQNAAEIAEALTRGIDVSASVSVGKSATYDKESVPEGFEGSGIAVTIEVGGVALVALLTESSGQVPEWVRAPDVTGESRLNTLAQELAMLVLPESVPTGKFGAGWLEGISKALHDADVADGAALVPLKLDCEGQPSQISLVWPCAAPERLLPAQKEAGAESAVDGGVTSDTVTTPQTPRPKPTGLEELPPYARHLLMISVPVSVRLVSKKLPVKDVIELAPGAMISFEKSCDGPLELTVGDHVIAEGAAVKVGERFGLEIGKMTLPEEHFWPVTSKSTS